MSKRYQQSTGEFRTVCKKTPAGSTVAFKNAAFEPGYSFSCRRFCKGILKKSEYLFAIALSAGLGSYHVTDLAGGSLYVYPDVAGFLVAVHEDVHKGVLPAQALSEPEHVALKVDLVLVKRVCAGFRVISPVKDILRIFNCRIT